MSTDSTLFFSKTYGPDLTLDGMVKKIVDHIKDDPCRFYKIAVGTDSESKQGSDVSLNTSVVVHRVGSGGIEFWARSEPKRFATMRDRIWQEAINSIMLGQELRSRLRDALGDDFFWDGNEIHVDIGENGPTRDLIEPVKGMIRAYNFEPVIKPDAYCASVVADRHT